MDDKARLKYDALFHLREWPLIRSYGDYRVTQAVMKREATLNENIFYRLFKKRKKNIP